MPSTPGSLEKALEALEADHKFLCNGDVFTTDVIETYLAYKRSHEVDEIRMRPHPYEFVLSLTCSRDQRSGTRKAPTLSEAAERRHVSRLVRTCAKCLLSFAPPKPTLAAWRRNPDRWWHCAGPNAKEMADARESGTSAEQHVLMQFTR